MSTPQYLMLKAGGARARMSILANAAASTTAPGANLPPSLILADWRAARRETFRTLAPALSAGFNTRNPGTKYETRKPVMVTFEGEQFRNEAWADMADGVRMDHRGWFTDAECSRTYRAFIYSLPHGRFGGGYACRDSGSRVYLLDVFDDVAKAASNADSEAEYFAELEREYSERWDAAQALQDDINDDVKEVRTYIKLRNMPTFEYCRDDARSLLGRIRANRAKLANEYSDIEV